jgi:stage III sporulation protein AG
MKNWKEILKNKNWAKLKKSDWIVLALAGVLLLVIAMPTGENSEKEEIVEPVVSAQSTEETEQTYLLELEQRVAEALTQMEGVGEARVIITAADEGEHVVEKDLTVSDGSSEETTVYVETKDATYPYIQKEKLPEVEGIMVVAEGGGNPTVVSEISEALQALFSVDAHRIKVVKMCSKEDSK